jgi:RNA-directed DNA polymerase
MAVLLILEPIFEADFLDCSYGFRPGRNAHQALGKIRSHIKQGFKAVYDADLSSYFDTIPHDKLIKCLETRIADRSILKLIRSWLKAPVVEPPDKPGGQSKVHRPKCGSPQGGVISPLLSNLYLHMFDKLFHGQNGPATFAKAKIVRYADDFVILAKYQGARMREWVEQTLEGRFELKVNRDKTRIVNLYNEEESLDFLGFTFRYHRDKFGRDKTYLNVEPSRKSLEKEKVKLRGMTSKKMCFKPIPDLIDEINRHLKGWGNYFKFGYSSVAFRKVNLFTSSHLLKHLRRRSQRPFKIPAGVSCYAHFTKLGLARL